MTTEQLNEAARQIMPAAPAGFTPATSIADAFALANHAGSVLRIIDRVTMDIGGSMPTTVCGFSKPAELVEWIIGQAAEHQRLAKARAIAAAYQRGEMGDPTFLR